MTIQDVFEAVGAHAAGSMTDEELNELESVASPGAGACGGQFTANTMATAFEMLGISAMGTSMVPAEDGKKGQAAEDCGRLVMDLLAKNLRPSDIITRESLDNAIACVAATGGSTNAVLHLLALAREADVPLSIDDFDRICSTTPLLADLKPGGRFVATDMFRAGGVAVVANRLQEAGLLNEDAITVTGRTIGEEAAAAEETEGQEVIRPLDRPMKATGGLAILRGNLAPEGCVVKLAGHDRLEHRGPARVFESEEDAFAAVKASAIKPNDVVVIRNEGPAGGPGMREMLGVTAALVGEGLGRLGRAAHRRPLLRRHPRLHGRPRRPRGAARRPDRGRARRRHRRLRRPQPRAERRAERGGDRRAAGRLRAAAAEVHDRRARQVRPARRLGVRGRAHVG